MFSRGFQFGSLPRFLSIAKQLKNEQIKSSSGWVQLILQSGENQGEIRLEDALKEARKGNLDLIQVGLNKKANEVPIVKIVDLREVAKKDYQQAKKKVRRAAIKELQISSAISDNDLNTKIQWVENFVSKGQSVDIIIYPKKDKKKVMDDKARAQSKSNMKRIYDRITQELEEFEVPAAENKSRQKILHEGISTRIEPKKR
eukprot:snap_masked-scaffold_6-processed-gene-15.58-mRNA-1 protein AED:0.00 eAED:0.00 QI:129/0/0.5/1/0/0.5/2/217/200